MVHEDEVAPDTAAPFRYHWYEYVPYPPLAEDENVTDCPLSMVPWDVEADIEGSDSTVTVAPFVVPYVPSFVFASNPTVSVPVPPGVYELELDEPPL